MSLTILRVFFIMNSILIGINVHPDGLLANNLFILANSFLIGFGNGLLGTYLMICGPKRVTRSEQEIAGIIMAFHLTVGRSMGSFISSVAVKQLFE